MYMLSIIVPVRNEARLLPNFLASLAGILTELKHHPWEVILVNCGSTDRSPAICRAWARKRARRRTITAAAARPSVGAAIRAGVRHSHGSGALVVPVDCRLTAGAIRACLHTLNAGTIWGGYEKTYRPASRWLTMYGAALNLVRTRLLGHLVWTNGIYFRSDAIARIGGVPVQGFLEDVALSDRLRALARPVILRHSIQVSSRRYQRRGILRQMVRNGLILLAYRLLPLSPRTLGKWYRR